MSKPELKEIPGFPFYFASSDGFIWSERRDGLKKLKPFRMERGYLRVTLYAEPMVPSVRLVHRLILLAFDGEPPRGKNDGCHENDIHDDNRLENLYWGTRKRNMQDAIRNEKTTPGEKNARAILTEEQVKEILRLRAEEGIGSRRLARRFGVTPSAVQLILSGVNWKHVERPERNPKFATQGDTIRGDRNPAAKTGEIDRKKIRELWASGLCTQKEIARMFDISEDHVGIIVRM